MIVMTATAIATPVKVKFLIYVITTATGIKTSSAWCA